MLSRKQAERFGLEQRGRLGRAALAEIAPRKFDPLDVLRQACRGQVARLVAEKFQRMKASPFAFFRGAVEIMAADLGAGKHTGIEVQLCGDAHLKNFGFFAGPAAEIVLDINDFDQTQRGPWEWDVKRMAVSILLAGRVARSSNARSRQAALIFLDEYAAWIRRFAQMPGIEAARHHATRDLSNRAVRAALGEAERAGPLTNLKKLAEHSGKHSYRLVRKPGLMWDVIGKERRAVLRALPRYRETLSPEHRFLFDRYRALDVGFKVVGTGSVGTRDYVVLFFGRDARDPLFLQIKEEPPSAYAPYYRDRSAPRHQGERVVQGQRALQVLSDQLLGWCSIQGRDCLVRQLNDHKASLEPESLKPAQLAEYSRVCAELLAKGHARSGDPAVLAAYLGRSDRASRALLQFAVKYADQTEKDFQRFKKALKKGFAAAVIKQLR